EMRPEIKAINTNHTITEKLISIRKGEFLPKLFLAGNYDWKRPNREIEPKFYDSWNVTLALKLDLFHGGAKYYRLEQAKLALRQVEQNQHMLADGIALEVRQAYLAVEEAEQALAIAGETIAQAEESYRVARENFQAGTATNADVLDAQNDLMQAQMQRVTSHADLLVAQAKLTRATTGF
ncbi:TolC family protein, partial [bacterium]|nr:TolC family protein [bacterium]